MGQRGKKSKLVRRLRSQSQHRENRLATGSLGILEKGRMAIWDNSIFLEGRGRTTERRRNHEYELGQSTEAPAFRYSPKVSYASGFFFSSNVSLVDVYI